MNASTETVAVLGAGGTMGRAMAANLLDVGIAVRAWNRTRDKAQPLADRGATACDTAAEAADGATVLLTMLADADAVLGAVDGALERLGDDAVWLQMSTIGIEGTERCAVLAGEHGVTLVDAPVLGTKAPAEAGELTVLASGPQRVQDRLAPLLEATGKRTVWLGEAGAGTRMKVVTNSWIVAVVEGAAETLALAEGLDVDPRAFLDAVGGGPLDLPYLQTKGTAMLERSFEPSFSLRLAAKDANLAVAAAERHELDLPVVRAIAQRLAQGAERHGDQDLSATFLTSIDGIG
jgi:3-hydroxyisobutyrate dehydrogenase